MAQARYNAYWARCWETCFAGKRKESEPKKGKKATKNNNEKKERSTDQKYRINPAKTNKKRKKNIVRKKN